MSSTTAIVLTENAQAYKQAVHTAEALGQLELARWLEASGPLLKLAGTSAKASDLVHTFRHARDVAAASPAAVAVAAYEYVRAEVGAFLKSGPVDRELREVVELELRRADALIAEARELRQASKWPKRAVAPSGLVTCCTPGQSG
jgi:hypothetical protein